MDPELPSDPPAAEPPSPGALPHLLASAGALTLAWGALRVGVLPIAAVLVAFSLTLITLALVSLRRFGEQADDHPFGDVSAAWTLAATFSLGGALGAFAGTLPLPGLEPAVPAAASALLLGLAAYPAATAWRQWHGAQAPAPRRFLLLVGANALAQAATYAWWLPAPEADALHLLQLAAQQWVLAVLLTTAAASAAPFSLSSRAWVALSWAVGGYGLAYGLFGAAWFEAQNVDGLELTGVLGAATAIGVMGHVLWHRHAPADHPLEPPLMAAFFGLLAVLLSESLAYLGVLLVPPYTFVALPALAVVLGMLAWMARLHWVGADSLLAAFGAVGLLAAGSAYGLVPLHYLASAGGAAGAMVAIGFWQQNVPLWRLERPLLLASLLVGGLAAAELAAYGREQADAATVHTIGALLAYAAAVVVLAELARRNLPWRASRRWALLALVPLGAPVFRFAATFAGHRPLLPSDPGMVLYGGGALAAAVIGTLWTLRRLYAPWRSLAFDLTPPYWLAACALLAIDLRFKPPEAPWLGFLWDSALAAAVLVLLAALGSAWQALADARRSVAELEDEEEDAAAAPAGEDADEDPQELSEEPEPFEERHPFPRLAVVIGAVVPTLALAVYWYSTLTLPSLEQLEHVASHAQIRVHKKGQELEFVEIILNPQLRREQIPQALVDALLTQEDRNFYHHFGIDLRGLARAVVLLGEGHQSGGSTLTQQLAKNLFLSQERTLARKARELLLAIKLERNFSKDEILTMYVNRVHLGNGVNGLAAATRYYFSKGPADLSPYEAALLVQSIPRPERSNWEDNPGLAKERAERLIEAMREQGLLEGPVAKRVTFGGRGPQKVSAMSILDAIRGEILELAGERDGPMVVITTLEPELQMYAERVVSRFGPEIRARGGNEAALVAMAADGAIRALVPNIDRAESTVDHTLVHRQLGSLMKPITYLAALEGGAAPTDTVSGARLTIDKWSPHNANDRYPERLTLSEALAGSYNTAAVRVLEAAGRDKVIALARRLGLEAPLRDHPMLTLGVGEGTLRNITQVYNAFTNGGRPARPYAVAGLRDLRGNVLAWRAAAVAPPVVDPAPLARLDAMLQAVVRQGTGQGAAVPGRTLAGKTGTTDAFRDAWFVGYTPGLTTGVWVGNRANEAMSHVSGGSLPAQIWREFMTLAFYVLDDGG